MTHFSDAPLSSLDQRIADRSQSLLSGYQQAIWRQTDRLFAILFVAQWLACIAMALWLSPLTWEGLQSRIHPHVWAAVFLGGLIAIFPIALAMLRPGETMTRMVISVGQMLHSALLIHLSGGRIETHFHVFGSLAFLSFYREWRVLVPATAVVAIDHALRGWLWPESVFGVLTASPWRWIEHAGWVIFEDIFLVWACVRGAKELAMLAMRQAELETTNERVEAEVIRKTAKLESITQELMNTARRAGMAEIATGVLHNVGNALNSINVSANAAVQKLKKSEVSSFVKAGEMLHANQADLAAFLTADERGRVLPGFLIELAQCLSEEQREVLGELDRMSAGLDHIKQIVGAQQQHAKYGILREKITPAELIEQAVAMTPQMGADPSVSVVRHFQPVPAVAMDRHKVLQIVVNLLSNAAKSVAAAERKEKRITLWIRLIEDEPERRIQFEISDNGVGIAAENLTRIFAHGFTTREDGHGFGLHSAANAARQMGGNLTVKSDGPNQGASFVLDLPLAHLTAAEQLMAREEVAA